MNFIFNNSSINDISTQVIPKFLGKIATYNLDNFHIDIGNIDTLKQSQHLEFLPIGGYFKESIYQLRAEIHEIEKFLRKDIV